METMLEYARSLLRQVEASLRPPSLEATLPLLRSRLGIDDFGELMFGMPNPEFPLLSRVLPRMASEEIQAQWTGATGLYLLQQTRSFVRSAAYHFGRLTGRSLDGAAILDYGCGYGRIARLMYYFTGPGRLIGVDPWDRSIAICRDCGLCEDFRQSDYLPKDLPVGKKTFDLIYAFSVFTHLSPRATRLALDVCRRYVARDGVLLITIRPVEYWSLDASVHGLSDTTALQAAHRREGFAFSPHPRPAVDGDVTYGDTSMTTEWIAASFPRWRIAGVDRSIDDPYQLYVFLRPA
jgi:SAM-dependent methyltransferase